MTMNSNDLENTVIETGFPVRQLVPVSIAEDGKRRASEASIPSLEGISELSKTSTLGYRVIAQTSGVMMIATAAGIGIPISKRHPQHYP